MEVKRPCGFRGKCQTLTVVDTDYDIESLGMLQTKWCDEHEAQYKREAAILTKLVPAYNKKKIKNKFGKIIKFSHHSDVSNYLFRTNKRELNKILKRAEN